MSSWWEPERLLRDAGGIARDSSGTEGSLGPGLVQPNHMGRDGGAQSGPIDVEPSRICRSRAGDMQSAVWSGTGSRFGRSAHQHFPVSAPHSNVSPVTGSTFSVIRPPYWGYSQDTASP